ncbi:hypothetical protein [Gibbsiella dentisursi]|uniref:hypothetical protein n=1 Tax=Gibbsiella dentisursi TaxID=796890 RepID=UPI0031F95AD8
MVQMLIGYLIDIYNYYFVFSGVFLGGFPSVSGVCPVTGHLAVGFDVFILIY